MPLRLPQVPYAIGGSGSAYIQGWVDKNFRAGMSEEECRCAPLRMVVSNALHFSA